MIYIYELSGASELDVRDEEIYVSRISRDEGRSFNLILQHYRRKLEDRND